MGSVFEVKNAGEMILKSFSEDPSGAEGMVIYNSTDKKVKFYNGTGWVDTGGALATTSKYDDFSAYSVGNSFNATYWTATTPTYTTVNIQSNAEPDGTQNVAKLYVSLTDNVGSASAILESKLLVANKTKFARFYYTGSTSQYAQNTSYMTVAVGNSTDGWTQVSQMTRPAGQNAVPTDRWYLVIVALGGDYYAVNGDLSKKLSKPNGMQIKVSAIGSSTATGGRFATATVYMSQIWEAD